ncbi:MAG: SusC/RagA family TonB-linked outer membrane protein [Cyclobacteriaceae bacterium]
MKKLYKSKLSVFNRLFDISRVLVIFGLMAFSSHHITAQERSISGTVIDGETGEGLPGVTVLIKGTTTGTITDFNGEYRISVSDSDVLSFSFIGYMASDIPVGNQSTVDITMQVDLQELGEVVVVGYGSVKKDDLTGAVDPVSAKSFNKGVLSSPDRLISGKVAGVQITANSGEPGGTVKIRIRGAASIGNGSKDDPLFVVDGVPIDNNTNPGSRNPLNFINPNDIENITVLKDASSTAIYGSRGAHGVIIITTKKGQLGQSASVSYDGSYAISQNVGDLGNLSPQNFRAYMRLKGGLRLDMLGDATTDWSEEVLQDATGQVHNLSVSGGTKTNTYRLAVGYQKLEGVLQKTTSERATTSFNFVQNALNEDLTVSFNNKFAFTKDRFSPGVIGNAFSFDPTQPVFDENSQYGGYFEWEDPLAVKNPAGELGLVQDFGKSYRTLGNLEVEYRIPVLEGLSVKANFGYDVNNGEKKVYRPTFLRSQTTGFASNPGSYEQERFSRNSFLFEGYGTYKRDLPGLNSYFDITGGYSYQSFQAEFPKYTIQGLSTDDFGLNIPVDPVEDGFVVTELNPVENRLISFFGRARYTLMDRYLITVNLRRDGSTRFGQGNKWGLFPSAAFKWHIIDEPFFQGQSIFDDLGIRVGYGVTGNQEIGDYRYLPTYSRSDARAQYQFGDQYIPLWRPSAVDPSLKWEQTASLNIAIDYGLWDNRISGKIDVYQKKTTDLLNEIAFPAGSVPGDLVLTNIGEVQNRGIEVVANVVAIDKQDLTLNVSFNAAYNSNEITKLDNNGDTEDFRGYETGGISGDVGQNIQILKVGEQINSFEVYEQIYQNGVPVNEQIDVNGDGIANLLDMYVDQNGDGLINENDRRAHKSPFPDWILGLTTSLNYKRLDVNMTLRSNIGNYVYNNNASNYGNVQQLLDRVPNNVHESVLETNFVQRQLFSDYYVENASFLKLDNISIGYTINPTDKMNIRVYSTLSNIFTLTGYTGQDPEAGSNGIDNNLYPFSRTLLFGASINF